MTVANTVRPGALLSALHVTSLMHLMPVWGQGL